MSEPTTPEPRPKNLWDLPIFEAAWKGDAHDIEDY